MTSKTPLKKRAIDALEPDPARDYAVADSELAGFRVRVRRTGRKTYEVRYRVGRADRLFVIGDHGPWTPDQARARAVEVLRAVDRGEDPQAERAADRAAMTVSELLALYVQQGPIDKPTKRENSWATDRGNFRLHVEPLLGAKPAKDLTPADLARWQADVASGKTARTTKTGLRGKSAARGGRGVAIRAMRSFGAALAWAHKRGMISENVATRVDKLQDRKLDRFLSPDEAVRLWRTLADMQRTGELREDHADFFRLLILTGARRGELLSLRAEEVDLSPGRQMIRLAPERHKAGATGRHRTIPLNPPACEVLKHRLEAVSGRGWLFPKRDGSGPIEPPKRAWERITVASELSALRVHDLRHTFASLSLARGTPLAAVGKLLGHAKASTTERYAHLADDIARVASAQVGELFLTAACLDPEGPE